MVADPVAMNGVDYIREALTMIEADLQNSRSSLDAAPVELGAARLAARIGFSVQHFSRLFRSLTGETPADYIQKRRLTEAARRLLVDATPAIRIAREGGWLDYETFSRAFKRHFGVSPSRAKTDPRLSLRFREPIDPACVVGPASSATIEADATARFTGPRLVEEGPIHLVGLPFFMDESVRSFHRPWAIFQQAIGESREAIRGRIRPERFCQFSSWLEEGHSGGLFIACCLEVEPPADPTAIPAPYAYRRLPACNYLVFTHTGGVSGLAESYQRIYGEGLAGLEHKAAFPWELQRYPTPSEIEIMIPVSQS